MQFHLRGKGGKRDQMDRSLATYDKPLLNQGLPYVSDSGRTAEDDIPLVYDAISLLRKRTHISQSEFETIYRDTMRFFTVQERFQFRMYQSGEKKTARILQRLCKLFA